jgi:single stranded DNA-binding protein
MAGINKVIIVGNLGGDPELKEIGSGKYVCNFSVATSEEWLKSVLASTAVAVTFAVFLGRLLALFSFLSKN